MTYGEYLNLESLLTSQNPQTEDEHDEMLFIIIHQTFELWFKQILYEYQKLTSEVKNKNASSVLSDLKRILVIMKSLVKQVDVLETMRPMAFLNFRKNLGTSSGFQSFQFRAIEFALGQKRKNILDSFKEGSFERSFLDDLYHNPSLFDLLLLWINDDYPGLIPQDILERDCTETYNGDVRVEDALLEVYKKEDSFSLVFESLLDWDEGLQEWRYRHIKLVERTMGGVRGTGGSSGIEYLKQSLFHPCFPDLWNLRKKF